jgi:hypothetical protein
VPRSSGRAIERGLARGQGRGVYPKRPPGESHGDEQIGPSMSTEPGWMDVDRASPLLLGEHKSPCPQNDPSMLLSFERPASVIGWRSRDVEIASAHAHRWPANRLSTVLENCTEATNRPPSISGGRITGITGPCKIAHLTCTTCGVRMRSLDVKFVIVGRKVRVH